MSSGSLAKNPDFRLTEGLLTQTPCDGNYLHFGFLACLNVSELVAYVYYLVVMKAVFLIKSFILWCFQKYFLKNKYFQIYPNYFSVIPFYCIFSI